MNTSKKKNLKETLLFSVLFLIAALISLYLFIQSYIILAILPAYIIGIILLLRHKTLQKKINYNDSHDSLTGLPNRKNFENTLQNTLSHITSKQTKLVLCYVDLDNFKIINDSAGHSAGDALLQEIGILLQKNSRKGDMLARIGGDEFAILFSDCTAQSAKKILERIIDLINSIHFPWENKIYRLGASAGMITISNNKLTANQLLSKADIACYSAKIAGRNCVHVYQSKSTKTEEQNHEILLASTLQEAVEHNRFVLYAQKITSANPDNSADYHFEILLRMLDENNNIIPATAFIPVAEHFNLMHNIDRWVLTQLLEINGDKLLQLDAQSFSINISANSLNTSTFLPFLLSTIEASPIPPQKLCFEITETAAMNNIAKTIDTVCALQKMGCKIALDDFGVGLSSFSYVKNFSVNYIKIDGSFIKNIVNHKVDATIVESINEMAHRLGIKTIAEFVENEKTLFAVRKMRIDYAQGFVIHEPRPLDALIKKAAQGPHSHP